jgi:hypothetical protein
MGDCCAVTTILEVTGWYAAAGLYDFRLESIEQNNLGSITVGWETTDVFGTVVKFSSENYSSRDVLILCSCSHNGYYGGWVEWREEHVTVPGEVVS